MVSLNIKKCLNCQKILKNRKHSLYCSADCKKTKEFKDAKELSYKIYTDNNKDEWVQCPHCAIRLKSISGQHIKNHGFTKEEFLKLYSNIKLHCNTLLNKMSSRVLGDKNPAYQHGGKLSPFSKKFVKYKDKTDDELESIFESLYEKSANTKDENNSNPLTLEYYTGRGFSENEARELLRERQATFTFGKCIERFGEEEGKRIWMERQEKWQNTLKSKSPEEIDAINKRKSTKVNYRSLWNMSLNEDGYFYIIDLKNNNYKIGITSKSSINSRYKKKELNGVEVIVFEKCKDINHAFQIEQLLKHKYLFKIIKNKSIPSCFGWTEIISGIQLPQLLEEANELLSKPDYSESKFKSSFKLKHATV
jgi:hypothetical protein